MSVNPIVQGVSYPVFRPSPTHNPMHECSGGTGAASTPIEGSATEMAIPSNQLRSNVRNPVTDIRSALSAVTSCGKTTPAPVPDHSGQKHAPKPRTDGVLHADDITITSDSYAFTEKRRELYITRRCVSSCA